MQEDLVIESTDEVLTKRAESLRSTFDERFRAPASPEQEATVDVLCVAVGHERVGVLIAETSQIVARPVVVRVPDAEAGCLGVLGHRGRLVAVFELAPDLGRTTLAAGESIVLVARRDPSVGFAAGRVLGYHRARRSQLIAPPDGSDASRLGTLTAGEPFVVLSIDELVDRLDAGIAEVP